MIGRLFSIWRFTVAGAGPAPAVNPRNVRLIANMGTMMNRM